VPDKSCRTPGRRPRQEKRRQGKEKETWLFNVQTKKRIYYDPEMKVYKLATNTIRVGSIYKI